MRRSLAALATLSAAIAASPAWAGDGDYSLGQGLAIGDDFLLSGYANVVVDAPRDGPSRLVLDDLSLFVSGRVNRWFNPFIEAEVAGVTLAQQGDGPRSGGHFFLERFYNDARLTDADTLRVGKILAPVGDWNLIHAAPLVPTVTRPLTTYWGFSEYASGVAWVRDDGGAFDWQLYWQPGSDWSRRPESIAPRTYRNVWGGHLNWGLGLDDKIGLSFQHGRQAETGGTYSLVGANFRRTFGALLIEGEAIASRRSGDTRLHDREWGGYVLADYAFDARWHGVLEAERYQDHQVAGQSRSTLVGIAYKPQPALVWKLEHVRQTGTSAQMPSGWFASFAVLF